MPSPSIVAKSAEEIEGMRASGALLAGALAAVAAEVQPGVSTAHLNEVADEFIRDHGGTPSFLGVPAGSPDVAAFPTSICASVNDVIVHGIPDGQLLREGDIIGIDCGVILGCWHTDAAVTLPVGEVSEQAVHLIAVTREALEEAIKAVRPGNHVGDIGAAVQRVVEPAGFSVVRRFVGHGIGRSMHETPQVPNVGTAGGGPALVAGLTLAIEPMVNAGSPEVRFDADGWTARTADGCLSAHFEHTVVVAGDGPVVLTRP